MKPIFTFPQPRRRLAEQSFHLKDRKTCPNKRSHRTRRTEIKLKSVYFGHAAKPSVVVEFTAVSERLRAPGRPTGFQLRNQDTGEDLEWIFKVKFTPDDSQKVILELAAKQQPTESLVLLYAPGATPFATIVDENDMAIPAFGTAPVGASPG
jgi:hypothetical protein